MPITIGISGFRRSGKTLLSDLIVEAAEEFGLTIRKLSFAAPIKQSFAAHMGIGLDTLDLYKESYRKRLETYSDTCKQEDPLVFTKMLLEQILPLDMVVVDDLRLYQEEVIPLLKIDAAIYRVHADTLIRIARGMIPDPTNDNSRYEQELFLPQEIYHSWGGYWVFNNKDDVDALRYEAKLIIRRHYLKNLKM